MIAVRWLGRRCSFGLMLLASAAWADLSVTITTPRQGEVIGDEVRVETVVSSTFQVGSVTLSVGSIRKPATFGSGTWAAVFDVTQAPRGEVVVTAEVTDVMGGMARASVTANLNRAPRIEVVQPARTVSRTRRLQARCVDDGPAPCRIKATIEGVSVTDGEGEVDVWFCDSSQRVFSVLLESYDAEGHIVRQRLEFQVEESANLRPVRSFEGRLLDFDGTRVLTLDGTQLLLGSLAAPVDRVPIGSLEFIDPRARPDEIAWLTRTGAAWRDCCSYSLFVPDSGVSRTVRGTFSNPRTRAEWLPGSHADAIVRIEPDPVVNLVTGESRAAGSEVGLSADGRFLTVSAGQLEERAFDAGAKPVPTGSTEPATHLFLENDRLGFLNGSSLQLRWDGGASVVEAVATKPFRWAGDWLAFSRREGNTTAVMLGFVDGGVERVSFFDGDSTVEALSAKGVVAFSHDGASYLAARGQAPRLLSSSTGRVLPIGDDWFVLEGGELFVFDPAADAGVACEPPPPNPTKRPTGCGCDATASSFVLFAFLVVLGRARRVR